MRRFLLLLPILLCAALLVPPEILRVDVCHATGSESNQYVLITVNINSVDDADGLNGHGDHEDDAWESFVYGGVTYPGQGDMENCDDETLTATPVPPTATDTPTATAEPTATSSPTPTEHEASPTATTTPVDVAPTATPTVDEIEPTSTATATATDAATEIAVPCPIEAPGRVCHSGSG